MVEKILCVGRGNICRSPMFMALLSDALAKARMNIVVVSAGVEKAYNGWRADRQARDCMQEIGLNLDAHRSRWAKDLCLDGFDIILCMDMTIEREVRGLGLARAIRIVLVNKTEGDILNPPQNDPNGYRHCIARMRRDIGDFVSELVP